MDVRVQIGLRPAATSHHLTTRPDTGQDRWNVSGSRAGRFATCCLHQLTSHPNDSEHRTIPVDSG